MLNHLEADGAQSYAHPLASTDSTGDTASHQRSSRENSDAPVAKMQYSKKDIVV